MALSNGYYSSLSVYSCNCRVHTEWSSDPQSRRLQAHWSRLEETVDLANLSHHAISYATRKYYRMTTVERKTTQLDRLQLRKI